MKIGDYRNGWRPEAAMREVVQSMLDIVFDPNATNDEAAMAATTIVEAIDPASLNELSEFIDRQVAADLAAESE